MKLKKKIKVAIDSPAAAGAGTQAKINFKILQFILFRYWKNISFILQIIKIKNQKNLLFIYKKKNKKFKNKRFTK